MLSHCFIQTIPADQGVLITSFSKLAICIKTQVCLCFCTLGKKEVVALEYYETDARIIYAQEITSSILSFLAMVTCSMFMLPSLNFFIGPCNKGNTSQAGKN